MRAFNRFFLLIVVLIISPLLFAKIEISESVKDFRYPRFSKSGFIEWVLRGQSGVYEDALISVELFNLRLYSADASTEVMCEVFSDSALLDTESGVSYSDESILIKGDGFEIKGADWLWDSEARYVEVRSDVQVEFDQNIGAIFSDTENRSGTRIRSDYLRLDLKGNRYLFDFKERVSLFSESVTLDSNSLYLESLNSSNNEIDLSEMGNFSGLVLIQGMGNTQALFSNRKIEADFFEIFPKREKAFFEKNAQLSFNNAYLEGEQIEVNRSNIFVNPGDDLTYCSLAFEVHNKPVSDQADQDEPSSIYIQSKAIDLSKKSDGHDFYFKEEVFYRSDNLKVFTDQLFVQTKDMLSESDSLLLQELVYSEANGATYIDHFNYEINCLKMQHYPLEDRLNVSGSVDFENDFVSIATDRLIVEGNNLSAFKEQQKVRVKIPYSEVFDFNIPEGDEAQLSNNNGIEDTVIVSDLFELDQLEQTYACVFHEKVAVDRKDFKLFSDHLLLNWIRSDESGPDYKLKDVIAEQSVKLIQNEFNASANKAIIYPENRLIELVGNAELIDASGSVSGERILFDRMSQKTEVLGSSESGKRAKVRFDLFEKGTNEGKDVLEE